MNVWPCFLPGNSLVHLGNQKFVLFDIVFYDMCNKLIINVLKVYFFSKYTRKSGCINYFLTETIHLKKIPHMGHIESLGVYG